MIDLDDTTDRLERYLKKAVVEFYELETGWQPRVNTEQTITSNELHFRLTLDAGVARLKIQLDVKTQLGEEIKSLYKEKTNAE